MYYLFTKTGTCAILGMIVSLSNLLRGDNVVKKEMIAMLLAGGQGSRLGVLTAKVAKPAVAFGGKYRIIDFPLSNCINSGVDTVGVLTQYQPLRLNTHIGIGIPWDLDRNVGGVTVLPPYEQVGKTEWYTGTANAIYQNLAYMESFNPDYVLILSGDHIYKMDYEVMLDFHKSHNADVSIAVMPVPQEEASRFGIVVADSDGKIREFQEKPEHPKSNLASMGIYIFSWPVLRDALVTLREQEGCDFGKHVIPYLWERGKSLVAYEFNGYWKDVGTLGSYWEVYRSLIGDGTEIYGEITNSIIGSGVTIEKGAVVRDSIIMQNCVVKAGAILDKAIIAEGSVIGRKSVIGCGEEVPNKVRPSIYAFGLAVVGENTVIPDSVKVGRNTAVTGNTVPEDYPDGALASGEILDKAGVIS